MYMKVNFSNCILCERVNSHFFCPTLFEANFWCEWTFQIQTVYLICVTQVPHFNQSRLFHSFSSIVVFAKYVKKKIRKHIPAVFSYFKSGILKRKLFWLALCIHNLLCTFKLFPVNSTNNEWLIFFLLILKWNTYIPNVTWLRKGLPISWAILIRQCLSV